MNRRRKLLMMSGGVSAEAKALFNAYKTRVVTDTGFVNSDTKTKKLFNDSVNNSLRDNLVFHVNSDAGNRGDVNKVYSIDGEANDFVQTVGANQPALRAQGWDFNGTTDRLEGGNPISMQTAGDKCIMAWAKADEIPSDFGAIFGAGFLAVESGIGIYINNTSYFAQVRQGLTVRSAEITFADADYSPTDFFHIACVRRGEVTELWLNGVLVDTNATAGAINSTPSRPFRIGNRQTQNEALFFNGIIDDCRAYNFAPSGDKITQIYNQTKAKYGIS